MAPREVAEKSHEKGKMIAVGAIKDVGYELRGLRKSVRKVLVKNQKRAKIH
jgi:hypothetical protein